MVPGPQNCRGGVSHVSVMYHKACGPRRERVSSPGMPCTQLTWPPQPLSELRARQLLTRRRPAHRLACRAGGRLGPLPQRGATRP